TEHSSDLFDNTTAARLLGHLEALLEAAAAAPERPISELPLLPEAERQQVLVEWNDSAAARPGGGPTFDALFAERAAARPGVVAAVCGGERLTYGELAARADRLARRLAAEGVGPESVVALVADRGLGFLTALLAAFKVGAAYLPIDPLHPLQRQMELLADSGARAVLASRLFASGLERPLAAADGPRLFRLEDLLDGEDATDAPLPSGAPERLAYVIYTSGSTGIPKGAMVEQRSMLNHLWAKIDALGLNEGDAVAQTASQCFDISVWQLLAALLVGGRVHIFPDEVAHDPLRLLGEADSSGVTVLETVPSLLRLMLDEIAARQEAAPSLSRLRWMIPTGEALPPGLCRRWLELYPHIPLVNAYGPTECSDDVTHWIVRTAPDDRQAHIPIGRPVPNLRLYTLGQAMQPLPAGVPGELYVGGAGVGRGYLGDSGRTAAAWVPDPFSEAPGDRLYRTGDLARRLADGRIEFLGRTDHQVKVRGHRIELGEIEAALASHPAVRQAAVLAREDTPGDRRLVAYVVAEPGSEPSTAELRRALAERLPDAMIPAAFLVLEAFPLTPSGKLDRKALPAPDATRPALDQGYSAPQTPAEETLARIWAQVLRLDRVGVHDNFFELGGDSILCIQVVTRAGQAGLQLTPRQMFLHQTIAELASVAGTVHEAEAEQGVVTGEAPLSPIQHWFFDQGFAVPERWNQALLLQTRERLDPAVLAAALGVLLSHHDALRLRFRRSENGRRQVFSAPAGEPPLTIVDLGALPAGRRSPEVAAMADLLHGGLDLERGPIARAAFYNLGTAPGRLQFVIHHLAVDGVSWQVLLEDLQAACRALARGEAPALPAKTLSFKSWAERLAAHARSVSVIAERDLWLAAGRARTGRLPVDHPGGANLNSTAGVVTLALDSGETTALLQEVPRAYHTQINDALLTALARTLARWTGERRVLVELEGHGREDLFEGVDLARTVGWFTSQFPLLLEVSRGGDPGEDLKAVKERLRAIPHGGVGWGLLRYLGDAETTARLAALPAPEILFNYQGQLDAALPAASLFGPAPESSGLAQSRRERRTHLLEVNGWIAGGRLQLSWAYSRDFHRRSTIEELAGRYLAELRALIEHCRAPEAGGYTPSDFAAARMSQGDLDKLLGQLGKGSRRP
ncbi:MAG TPA: amino acid adenylation domain-containing protein, partial [Thermoanaerobaculia bacterium]